MNTGRLISILIALWLVGWTQLSYAQDTGTRMGAVKRGGKVDFSPQGPGVLFDALDPAVRKWYVPQELFNEYRWNQWQYTNYARNRFQRYVSTVQEGDYFYDIYGNFVTRGWLVYDWQQDRPQQFGSSILKTNRYNTWFNKVIIASDSKGQYHYSLTIGDEIRTTLTPMTFSKPGFNGIQWDFAADKYLGTMLLARPSRPGIATGLDIPDQKTSVTNLLAGRGVAYVGDFIQVGATYVTAFQTQTLLEDFSGNPFSGGSLTTDQNALPISTIVIRLSDDSPQDGVGGAALFDDEIIIKDIDGNVVKGSSVGFEPIREGGFQRVGFRAADGDERITLTYDFTDPGYLGPDPSVIDEVSFELVISNDYRVEITSDRQTNKDTQPVFLLVERAEGNIRDNSNQRLLKFAYGLPTANVIFGFTLEAQKVWGFDFYGEYDFNRQYRQYPNTNLTDHETAIKEANAWMFNLSRVTFPWFAFAEGYSMDDAYSTRTFLAGTLQQDEIDYENDISYVYEFVEDNDDQDRRPDWNRFGQPLVDNAVFPGYDENNDFISDFNQNDTEDRQNFVPDYEEPFLRYHADRPEFLFGVDMNNNGWIDRFENDEEPDYPYGRDHRGYNLYGGVFITPEAKLILGRLDEKLISGDGQNKSTYLLLTYEKDFANLGRMRFYENLRLVEDDIANNLFQWIQPANSRGTQQRIFDPLSAPDTWINTSYAQLDFRRIDNLNVVNKLKFEFYDQRQKQTDLRSVSSFLGLINKADYTFQLGRFEIEPRVKSEFVRARPSRKRDPAQRELTETFFLISRFPLLRYTLIELGLELSHFEQFRDDKDGVPLSRELAPDSNSRIFAIQFSNASDYLGYKLHLQTGFRLQKENFENLPDRTTSTIFMTAYAGLGQ
ncbi:MAG: hypothetical protein HOC74_10830 [Gemmatimonadetes bacterium]|nr:hypothetical protein [Gemmatimonadota bacterium]